jgi:hypothetical protein
VHGNCGPDWIPGYQGDPDYGLENIDVELEKASGPRGGVGEDPTPAQVLMVMPNKAKAARAAKQAGKAKDEP